MKVKLDDVCERGSSSLKQSDIINKTGDYPIFGAAGHIGNVDFYHQEKPYVAVVKDGAGIGRTTLFPAKSSVIGTMQYLLPKENVLPEYLCYVVRYMHLEKYYTGATIPHIYFKDYKNEEFNLDSIERQQEIIDILGRVEKVIENRRQELQKLDELIKARFVEMFGLPTDKSAKYPKVQIGNLIKQGKASIKAGPFGSSLKKEFYVEKGYKIYGQEQVIKDDPTFGDYYIDEQRFNSLKSCEVHAGDILISLVGTCGKTMIMPEVFEPGIINPRLLKIAFDSTLVLPIYFKYFFASDDLQESINSISGHSTMNVVNAGMLKNIELIVPPIEKQMEFVAFVKQVDKSKSEVQKALDKSQLLFDSLMQQYFG